MPQDFPQLECRAPLRPDFDRLLDARPFAPFSEPVMAFLQGLSSRLLQDPAAKGYPDVISFAFWCRKGALLAMKERHADAGCRLGRGVVFHRTPSNVPVNFAYSLAAGLLAGNANVVRVPTRKFPQVELICAALRELLAQPEHGELEDHLALVSYERDEAITGWFSARCDVRIIWGGDNAIAEIRQSPLPARSFDLTFADRYSFCAVNADTYLGAADHSRIAHDFYNDTYLFDQNACTAPHLVIWLGGDRDVAAAKTLFWSSLHTVVAENYRLQPVSAVDKLSDAYRFAAGDGTCRLPRMEDNLIIRIELERLTPGVEEFRSACGCFYEYSAASLDEIVPLINRKFQTMAYYGLEQELLHTFMTENRPTGIDRIVPIGRTLDFSLEWDGYDLVCMLSRYVSLVA